MARLAIFVDGGYVAKLGENEFSIWVDLGKLIEPIFQQKRVDLLLGLDFALLSGKRQVTHAAVVSGDSDLIPALEVARQEGILVWLVHGPKVSRTDGKSTYAQELWDAADERLLLTQVVVNRCARPPRPPRASRP